MLAAAVDKGFVVKGKWLSSDSSCDLFSHISSYDLCNRECSSFSRISSCDSFSRECCSLPSLSMACHLRSRRNLRSSTVADGKMGSLGG